MFIFLVIVSLTLNILAFIIIAILFLRQNKLFKLEDQLKSSIHEIEELTTAYLFQMKEENDRFIKQLNELKKDGQRTKATSLNDSGTKETRSEYSDQHNISIDQFDIQGNDIPVLKKTISQQALKAYQRQKQNEETALNTGQSTHTTGQEHQPGIPIKISDNHKEQVIQLRKQGYSIEEIAKKLNKGKTEIELLLKFKENIHE